MNSLSSLNNSIKTLLECCFELLWISSSRTFVNWASYSPAGTHCVAKFNCRLCRTQWLCKETLFKEKVHGERPEENSEMLSILRMLIPDSSKPETAARNVSPTGINIVNQKAFWSSKVSRRIALIKRSRKQAEDVWTKIKLSSNIQKKKIENLGETSKRSFPQLVGHKRIHGDKVRTICEFAMFDCKSKQIENCEDKVIKQIEL